LFHHRGFNATSMVANHLSQRHPEKEQQITPPTETVEAILEKIYKTVGFRRK